MKQLYTFLFLSILFVSPCFAQWNVLTSGTEADLHDVVLTSENVGYAVGADAVVVKSLDGGATWSHKMIVRGETFKAIHFFDDQHGIVVGYRGAANEQGIILRTYNGGESWFVTTPGDHPITDVTFISEKIGFICGHGGFIMRSENGGDSWEQIYLPHNTSQFNDITFENSRVGYVTGKNVVMKTLDGGHTWKMVNGRNKSDLPQNIIETASFSSSANGAMEEFYHSAFNTTMNDRNVDLEKPTANEISKIIFPNSNTGFAAGTQGLILHTGNSGQSWRQLSHPLPDVSFTSASFINENNGLFVGKNGTILKSTGDYFSTNPTLHVPAMKIPLALAVYPNPVQYEANIKLENEVINGELLIYNDLGQLVQKVSAIQGDQISFATCQLNTGRYSFQLVTMNEVVGTGTFVVAGDGLIGRS